MKIFYTDQFVLPLPPGHRFPMEKYAMLRERVVQARLGELRVPAPARDEDLWLAHSQAYVERVQHGTLDGEEVRRIGFPWSPAMVERSRRSTGATMEAGQAALREGCGVNLAGGTHHAFHDHGQGYCVFNDSVVAARTWQRDLGVGRVLVVDCDVHQGNGTAALCQNDPSIFTFSIHGEHNFPSRKESSDFDVGLPDGTDDVSYLHALQNGLWDVLGRFTPDVAIYLSGADAYEGDRLGRLKLTQAGLARRDELVMHTLDMLHVPIVITMGGGYGKNIEDTVSIHFETVRRAAQRYAGRQHS